MTRPTDGPDPAAGSGEGRSGDPGGARSEHVGLRWQRLIDGDEDVLAELYDEYSPLILRVAYRITADRAAAEDVVQEVFVHVWRRAVDFDPGRGTLRSWLCTIARRRAVDRVRSDSAWRRRTENVDASDPDGPESAPDPADLAADADLARIVRRVVDGLPAEQQLAVRLAYFEGRSYRQVAGLLGIPEGTVKSRMRLAMSRMAAALASEGVGSPT